MNRKLPDWLTYLDHTADEGIAVTAPDLPALFERAAWGMFSIVTDPGTVRAFFSCTVRVRAPDLETLMARWLSELNFIHQSTRVLFCAFDVRKFTGDSLEAEVGGERIDPARHAVHTEIKAVTYHGLSVEEKDGAWAARVLFDV